MLLPAPPRRACIIGSRYRLEDNPLDIDIRPITPDEFGDFALAAENAFGHQPRPEELDNYRKVFEFDRSLAAFEGGTIVGTAGAVSFRLTVPGGSLPMPGVTAVAVLPTHRRRGFLTMLMRRQLDDVREAGEPLAGLWASEGAIYQRFGYGLATFLGRFEIDRQRTAFARTVPWEGSVRQVLRDEAMGVFPPVHQRVVERYPGMIGRTKAISSAAAMPLPDTSAMTTPRWRGRAGSSSGKTSKKSPPIWRAGR